MSDDTNDKKGKRAVVLRDGNGRLVKGSASNNPKGKIPGIEKMVRNIVMQQEEKWDGKSLDGWEAMTLMMYKIAMGQKFKGQSEIDIKVKDRMEAVRFLFDRVYGKPTVKVESDSTVRQGMPDIDVDALPKEALDELEAHIDRIAARAMGVNVEDMLDVAPADVTEKKDK